jgi:hypothetical protein
VCKLVSNTLEFKSRGVFIGSLNQGMAEITQPATTAGAGFQMDGG